MIAKPPTTSRVSAKGPSVTMNFPSESRKRAPGTGQTSLGRDQPARFHRILDQLPHLSHLLLGGGHSGLPGLYKHRNRIVVFLSAGRLEWISACLQPLSGGFCVVPLMRRTRMNKIDRFSDDFSRIELTYVHYNSVFVPPDSWGSPAARIRDSRTFLYFLRIICSDRGLSLKELPRFRVSGPFVCSNSAFLGLF